MTGDPIMIPVYKPMIDETHNILYANTSHDNRRELHKHVLPSDIGQEGIYNVHDGETFAYNDDGDPNAQVPMVEATCLNVDKVDKTKFNGVVYAKIKYNRDRSLKTYYLGKGSTNPLEIPTVIDNGASVSIIPMWYYQKHRLLHSLPKTRTNLPPIATGNGPIDT